MKNIMVTIKTKAVLILCNYNQNNYNDNGAKTSFFKSAGNLF